MTYFNPTHDEIYSLLSESTLSLESIISSSTSVSSESKKITTGVGVDYVTPPTPDVSSLSVQCRRGVDFILTHLEKPIFPRDIMTKKLGYKIKIFDKEVMLRHFKESDYLDCRISAYPRLTQYKSINFVAPSLIMIDVDLANFELRKKLDDALKATLKRICNTLKVRPTVLWTGNGYHVYLPIKAFILEEEEVFARFQNGNSNDPILSTEFMRFAEKHFTNNKHDQRHRPSVNSCLLRIPGTYNSKNGQQVRVIQKWDGKKAAIQYLLRDFRRYLIQMQLDEINHHHRSRSWEIAKPTSIGWIERLLQTPIIDNRRYCVWRILAPYLVNVKGFSDEESYYIINLWLQKCSLLRKLSFDPRFTTKQNIRNARRVGYYPISYGVLKQENTNLHKLLSNESYSSDSDSQPTQINTNKITRFDPVKLSSFSRARR